MISASAPSQNPPSNHHPNTFFIMEGNLWFIIKLLPYLAFCCLISGFVGWSLRGRAEPASPPEEAKRKALSQPKPRKQRR